MGNVLISFLGTYMFYGEKNKSMKGLIQQHDYCYLQLLTKNNIEVFFVSNKSIIVA